MTELEQAIATVRKEHRHGAYEAATIPLSAAEATVLNAVATGQLVPAQVWQPMNGKWPKDGESVILATTGGHVGQAMPPDPGDEDDYWYWCDADCRVHPEHKPIGWMPLPAAPTE